MNKLSITIILVISPIIIFAQSRQLGSALQLKPDSLPPIAVIELFSSEGCNSCPPADNVINKIAVDAANNHQSIYVIEEHVDHLNGFGWVDTFATKQFTQRQIDYQDFFNRENYYTPQILVNGTHEVISANLEMAMPIIQKALTEPAKVTVAFTMDQWAGYDGSVDYHLSKTDTNWVINFVLVKKVAVSHVTGGENAGHTLTHVNVALQLESDAVTIANGIIKFSGLPIYTPNTYLLIAFVQDKRTMKIVGALQEIV